MTASSSASFASSRKKSISSGSAPYEPVLASPMPMSPSPIPGSGPHGGFGGASKSSADGGIGASLVGPGGAALMLGAPAAANTIANKPAVAGSSLYQACLNLRDRLYCVPSFGEQFLDEPSPSSAHANGSSSRPSSPTQLGIPKPRISSDPVTQLWQCFRLGAPLCALFNTLKPEAELAVNPDANRSNANACKAQVAKFIIALKAELGWDPDEIFTVTQLYLNDTNGFVKVVRTINKLLDIFQARGLLTESGRVADSDELEKPADDRARVVRELLDTERKYVQDLEVMQNYARALAQMDILPPDTIHNLFGNLNTLVDVQRRFLICVEENVRRPPDDQHFGHVFRTMENDFSVYEPFCANYAKALDIINAEAPNIMRLKGMPAAEGCYLDPAYELPTFLIKPVQRICKYPLLLEQLLKKTPTEATHYHELVDGLQVIRRITDKVNETRRLQENIQVVKELESRVEDWKGHNINTFGSLLLEDVFMVAKSDTEREYHVFLFEKILLCCKEVLPNNPKKNSKSNSLLKQKLPPGKKSKTTLQLKGRIFINNVTGAFSHNKMGAILGAPSGQYALQVWWRGDVDQESFSLRCKNEEQLKQWQTVINRLIDEVTQRRQHVAAHYSQSNMAGAGANGRRNTATSSHFPQTPLSEYSPVYPLSRAESQASHRPVDDDEIEGMREGYDGYANGRATPMGGRYPQSLPPAERHFSTSSASHENQNRPRARTEDQDSSLMSQWRSHSPAMPPPLPRNSSGASAEHQLRKASSSRQLRQPGYTAHSGYPRPPLPTTDGGAMEYAESTSPVEALEQFATGVPRPRGDSTAGMAAAGSNGLLPHSRSRSASSPQAFLPPGVPRAPMPPVQHQQWPDQNGGGAGPAANGGNGNGAVRPEKRFSSSSISTVDSAQSGQSRPQSTAASSPTTLNGSSGSLGGHPSRTSSNATPTGRDSRVFQAATAIKVQVHFGDDRFVVVVLSSITFDELVEKVSKKVKLCSGRRPMPEAGSAGAPGTGTAGTLRIRYIDEDGDRIMMHDDDDVQMAFESSKATGTDVELVVS